MPIFAWCEYPCFPIYYYYCYSKKKENNTTTTTISYVSKIKITITDLWISK